MVNNKYWTGQNIQSDSDTLDRGSDFGGNLNRDISSNQYSSADTFTTTYNNSSNHFGSTNRFNTNEQRLVQSMVSESININGITVKYMPRASDYGTDEVWNEAPESYFDKGFNIDALLESATGFEGEGDVITTYGIEFKEEVILKISIDRFDELEKTYVDSFDNADDVKKFFRERPQEGDLIAIPFGRSSNNNQYYPKVFEILRVATFRDGGFFQLGDNFQYRVQARLYDYSYEQLEFTPRVTNTVPVIEYRDSDSVEVFDGYHDSEEVVVVEETFGDNVAFKDDAEDRVEYRSPDSEEEIPVVKRDVTESIYNSTPGFSLDGWDD